MLLGCYCNNPHLVLEDRYLLDKDDIKCKGVEESDFYYIAFRTIYNLARDGADEINGITFDMFLQNYPHQLEICKRYSHMDFINTIKETTDNNIDLHYNKVRKYSLLREYKSKGFDITHFYDELKDTESQKANLDGYTIDDIVGYYTAIQSEVKDKYVKTTSIEHHQLGDNIEYSIEKFKSGANIGLAFSDPYLNRLSLGYTGLTLVSGDSGSGKSMVAIGNVCKSACEYLYDETTKRYEKNPSFVGNALFINTELKFNEEVQPMVLAYISGVERAQIKEWKLTEDEEMRVMKATEILKDHLFCVDMPDFTISSLEETIGYYVAVHDIKMCAFDYIHFNYYMGGEVSKNAGVNNREDMVLLELTRALKNLSLKYEIPILTGTQLNRNSREKKQPDSTWLAGGISQEFKSDIVLIITQITKEDECDLEAYSSFFTEETKPTHCIHAIKSRNSKYPKGTRVYTRINLGTGRLYSCFCTDKNMELLDVVPMEIAKEI